MFKEPSALKNETVGVYTNKIEFLMTIKNQWKMLQSIAQVAYGTGRTNWD